MKRSTIVEIHQAEASFSAGHFTIFSATDREDLHGHNYSVALNIEASLEDSGLSFDYRLYKSKLLNLCKIFDRKFILPSKSAYLQLDETDEFLFAHFNNERIPFLKRDIIILPISNVTIEELAFWFLEQITENTVELERHHIKALTVKVFNGPNQAAHARWKQ